MGSHQITFARVIVVDPVGHVLLVRDHVGYWSLPGGKVEPGEMPAAAAARELQEETGLAVVEIEEIHRGDYEFDGAFWTGHFYRAQCVSGQAELQEPDKATELAYRDPAEVRFHPAVSAAMTALLSSSSVLGPTVNSLHDAQTAVGFDRSKYLSVELSIRAKPMKEPQIPPTAGDADEQVREAVAAEMQLLDPVVRRSRELTEALLDPEFVEVGASGRRWNRHQMLTELPTMPGFENDQRIAVSDIRGVLLVPGLVHLTYQTNRGGRQVLRSSLWRKGSAVTGWRMFYHQGTPKNDDEMTKT